MSKKTRLLGKVNYLDLLMIIIILGVVIFSFTRTEKYEEFANTNLQDASITVIAQGVTENLVNTISTGDKLVFSVQGTDFGTIESFEAYPHKELAVTAEGISYYKAFDDLYDVKIVTSSKINKDTVGSVMVTGNPLYIGQEQRLKSHIYVFPVLIDNIETDNE